MSEDCKGEMRAFRIELYKDISMDKKMSEWQEQGVVLASIQKLIPMCPKDSKTETKG